MAIPWPKDETWPADYREHAAKLSKYVHTALSVIDNADGQLVVQNIHTETKAAAAQAAKNIRIDISETNDRVEQAVSTLRENTEIINATNTTAKEAVNVNTANMKVVRDLKIIGQANKDNVVQTYDASVAAMYNAENLRQISVQTFREIIVNGQNAFIGTLSLQCKPAD
ncbi:hypothetical protein PT974_10211 [Cladobotryum mycophilum]|uniref:Uncharacterized protein n=1 Tax=Cladobotryum mycophilum TaxID=491253 RepID=A0ABR0S976_9HYPO